MASTISPQVVLEPAAQAFAEDLAGLPKAPVINGEETVSFIKTALED